MLLAGCETARFDENKPVSDAGAQVGYSYSELGSHTTGNSEEHFVILTFSGGGTRAAALAFGVLEKLRQTTITINEKKRNIQLPNTLALIYLNARILNYGVSF